MIKYLKVATKKKLDSMGVQSSFSTNGETLENNDEETSDNTRNQRELAQVKTSIQELKIFIKEFKNVVAIRERRTSRHSSLFLERMKTTFSFMERYNENYKRGERKFRESVCHSMNIQFNAEDFNTSHGSTDIAEQTHTQTQEDTEQKLSKIKFDTYGSNANTAKKAIQELTDTEFEGLCNNLITYSFAKVIDNLLTLNNSIPEYMLNKSKLTSDMKDGFDLKIVSKIIGDEDVDAVYNAIHRQFKEMSKIQHLFIDVKNRLIAKQKIEDYTKTQYLLKQYGRFNETNLKSEYPLTSKVMIALQKANDLNFDIFQFSRITEGNQIAILLPFICDGYGVLNNSTGMELKLDKSKLILWSNKIKQWSNDENPYNNTIHACDMLQTVHFWLNQSDTRLASSFSWEDRLGLILAAVLLDFAHPGITQQLLINIDHQSAKCYNNIDVLENYTVSQALYLTKDPKYDIFVGLNSTQKKNIRQFIIQSTLATNIHKREKLMRRMNRFTNNIQDNQQSNSSMATRKLGRNVLLHLTTISNFGKKYTVYKQWSNRRWQQQYITAHVAKELNDKESYNQMIQKEDWEKNEIRIMEKEIKPFYFEFHAFMKGKASKAILAQLENNRNNVSSYIAHQNN